VLSAVPLSGGLAGGAEHACDRGPGHTSFASRGNRLGNAAFGGGALGHCVADGVQWRSIADACRLVLLEPTLQFVGMFEDLLQATGHGHHLKYFLRVVIAWTMNSDRYDVDELGKSDDVITVARVEVEAVGVGCSGDQQVRESA